MRWLACVLAVLPAGGGVRASFDESAFRYAYGAPPTAAAQADALAQAAEAARRRGDAAAWIGAVVAMLEGTHAAGADRFAAARTLDAALVELRHADARALLAASSEDAMRSLRELLAALDPADPVGIRGVARARAQRRIAALEGEILAEPGGTAALAALLERRGRPWAASIDPEGVWSLVGPTRSHAALPPAAHRAPPAAALLREQLRRARGFASRIDALWDHADGPRLHDFVLGAILRDETGVLGLVHADTIELAQLDRARRWWLREAIARLGATR
ncbi:MAG: hypothetical protein AAFX79_09165 [Planctomycetota bacterium]